MCAAQYRALVDGGALVMLDEKTRDGAVSAVTNANENVGRKVLAQMFDRQRHRAHVLDPIADGNIAVRLMALILDRASLCRVIDIDAACALRGLPERIRREPQAFSL